MRTPGLTYLSAASILCCLLFPSHHARASGEASELDVSAVEALSEEEEHVEPAFAVLFPPFTLTVGVLAFFVLSRYVKTLPYTAVMFLIGTLMGISAALADFSNHISTTLDSWIRINSEVLLLVFLPGLIFKDAFGQNVHLFGISLGQLLIFAFPMVLAGTVLGALIGYYIFPFGWSFNLAMTVGSILAATDPVAVAALLEEVGAPPRLKVHVAGEALLNDGSAIVFFSIFSERYFYEFGIPGFGENVDLAKGVGMFAQKALGGAAVGIFFGLGLLGLLFVLNRRFSREENVVQVTAVIAIAYLNYYVSDFVLKTSGVIATVVAGVIVKLLGRAMVNDLHLLEDFLTIVEHILNTILFTLGGAVWGAVIAQGENAGVWTGKEWGYLIILYVLLNVIRALQFTATYPITRRIGLRTCWQETAFQIFGGLRGAVGIALAIALDNDVAEVTGGTGETEEEIKTKQAFAMVGGIAFLTLMINGTMAGPFLRKLGLADSSDARQRIVSAYRLRIRSRLIDGMVKLLCQKRFHSVNFGLVKVHVPYISDLTVTQLLDAIEKYKSSVPSEEYNPPHLSCTLPFLFNDAVGPFEEQAKIILAQVIDDHENHERNTRIAQRAQKRRSKRARAKRISTSNLRHMMNQDPLSTQELRILFLSTLRSAYDKQIEEGELDDAHILAVSLDQSLEFALDEVTKGGPLKDWEYLTMVHKPIKKFTNGLKTLNFVKVILKKTMPNTRAELEIKGNTDNELIERSLSFMAAHRSAQASFNLELQDADSELNEATKIVLEESKEQYKLAENALNSFDDRTKELAITLKFCKILLTMGIHWTEKLVAVGLLKESEAEPLVEEIEEHLDHIDSCDMDELPLAKEEPRNAMKLLEEIKNTDSDPLHDVMEQSRDPLVDEGDLAEETTYDT